MKSPRHLLATGTLFLILTLLSPAPARAVLGLFEKEDKAPPSPEEVAQNEKEAREMLARAQRFSEENRPGKARDLYKDIVEKYPLTESAAVSQFAIGESLEAEGDLLDAFNAYQVFVANYIHEEKFAEAIKRQFEITMQAKEEKASRIFGVFKAKTQPSRVVEMFRKIANSAPYSEYAPKAIYHLALTEHDAGHQDEALSALQEILDKYPKNPIAKDASLKMIDIRESLKTRDDSHIERTQIEMEKFLYDYGDDPRAKELREKVVQLDEREAKKNLKIARYYQKKGSLRAAAIYYQTIPSGSAVYDEAQAGLEELADIDPNLVRSPSAPKKRVVAPNQVTDKPDYVGPPPPRLNQPRKPKMRVSEEELQPIPVE